MTNVVSADARLAVRASDAERDQTVALLQRSFVEGRLGLAELEERAGAAYAARTRTELCDLTSDLPAERLQRRPRGVPDRRLPCILLCVHPAVGLVYWLLSLLRNRPQPASRDSAAAGMRDYGGPREESTGDR
jgi:hypothetical protein